MFHRPYGRFMFHRPYGRFMFHRPYGRFMFQVGQSPGFMFQDSCTYE